MLFREFRWILQNLRERAYPPQSLKHPKINNFSKGLERLSSWKPHFLDFGIFQSATITSLGYREKWVRMGHETKRVEAM